MGLIYKVTNKINNKVYIGQTTQTLEKRKKQHSNKGYYFHDALNKYGEESFIWEILEDNVENNLLNEREIYWINYFQSNNKLYGYNLTAGGNSNIESLNNWRKNHPDEVYKNSRRGWEIMRKILAEHPEKEENRKNNALIGIQKFCKEHPNLKRELGKRIYINHKEAQDNQMKLFHQQQSKKVQCIETGQIYSSASEAGRQMNISQGNISSCCRGERQSAGKDENGNKLHWLYLD